MDWTIYHFCLSCYFLALRSCRYQVVQIPLLNLECQIIWMWTGDVKLWFCEEIYMVNICPCLWCCDRVFVFSVAKVQRMVTQIGTHQDSPQLRDQLWVDQSWLQWCHMNVMLHGVLNQQPLDCLFNSFCQQTLKRTSKLCITDCFWGESTGDWCIPPSVAGGFSSQRGGNADNFSMLWNPHVTCWL